ncbi:MAG: GNAT family N-acetyltransferase [Bacteroidetes bacterium]|nr:MAG: GNAT family N-acetyltransferase [Bacteroidota bacterium]
MIRIGNPEDTAIIADFNQKMAWETEKKQLDPTIINPGVEAVLKDSSKGFYLLFMEDNEVVGQLMVTYEWSDWRNNTIWWIQSVYVREDQRGKGIYTALYEEVKRRAKEAGIQTIRLYVEKENARAQRVYRHHGMEATHYDLFEVTLA